MRLDKKSRYVFIWKKTWDWKKKSNTFLFEETLDFKKKLFIHKGNFINHLRSIMHKSCDYHINHKTWKKDMNKLGHACKQKCESWKYWKKRTYRLSTCLHELTLWEGITLEIRENESLWDLKYGRLTEKKILKQGFQNFFNLI